MNIREARPEDAGRILELIRELAAFEKEPEAVIIDQADILKNGFSSNPLFSTFVAEINQEIVGIALFYYRYSTWKGKTIHLEDLIVTQKARGTGAGTALYKAVLERAKSEGLQRVEWAVLDWNEAAISFYEKSGAKVLPDWRVCQMDAEALENYLTTQKQ